MSKYDTFAALALTTMALFALLCFAVWAVPDLIELGMWCVCISTAVTFAWRLFFSDEIREEQNYITSE